MHYLHKILVYVPDVIGTSDENLSEKELFESIRSHAENETESFCEEVFDWRETDSAGRWSDRYPQQVYLAEKDLDWFIKELQDSIAAQRNEIEMCMEQLKSSVGTNLEDIVNGLWTRKAMYDSTDGFNVMTPYYLNEIAAHLYGRYRCDSYFYNVHDCTARLYNSDLDMIRQEPQNWALVMFDYHY